MGHDAFMRCAALVLALQNWMIPTATANVCKPLGRSRRHLAFPWIPDGTDNIAHIYEGAEAASPRVTRASIRQAIIPS